MGKISERFKNQQRHNAMANRAINLYREELDLEIQKREHQNNDFDLIVKNAIEYIAKTWFSDIKKQRIISVEGFDFKVEDIVKAIMIDVNDNTASCIYVFTKAYEDLQNKLLVDKEQAEISTDILKVLSNKTEIKSNKEPLKP